MELNRLPLDFYNGHRVRPSQTLDRMTKPLKEQTDGELTQAILGSALDEIGFRPLGRRVKIKAGNQPELRRPASAPDLVGPQD